MESRNPDPTQRLDPQVAVLLVGVCAFPSDYKKPLTPPLFSKLFSLFAPRRQNLTCILLVAPISEN